MTLPFIAKVLNSSHISFIGGSLGLWRVLGLFRPPGAILGQEKSALNRP
jgi:hypothetical protein